MTHAGAPPRAWRRYARLMLAGFVMLICCRAPLIRLAAYYF